MKKFIMLAVACLFFTAANAQVNFVDITNNTPYYVYVIFHGDVSGNGCANGATSMIKQIAPGAIFTTWPGHTGMGSLSMGDEIIGVDIYDSWYLCSYTMLGSVGESCFTGSTTYTTPYTTTQGSSCAPSAGQVNSVTWTNVGGGTATLDFN